MRYTSGVAPAVMSVAGDEPKRVAGIRPVRRVDGHSNGTGVVRQPQAHVHAVPGTEQRASERIAYTAEERRIAARRILHQAVLLELRSGIERRHHNLRDGDIVEHIDVQA